MLDLCRFLSWFRPEHFFTGGSVIIDYGLLLFNLFDGFVSAFVFSMLTDGLEWSGLLVDYCDVFSSSLDSHSDGTHSLQSIHCWDSNAMTHFSKSDEETNSSTSWMDWGWAHFQQIFIFDCTIPLKEMEGQVECIAFWDIVSHAVSLNSIVNITNTFHRS